MSDRVLRIKSYRAGSGLVRRLFFLMLLFITLPILIHGFFLYRMEYNQKREDTELLLNLLGRSQKALFEERLNLTWDFLQQEAPLKKARLVPHPGDPQNPKVAFIDSSKKNLIVGIQIDPEQVCAVEQPISEILYELSHLEETPYPIFLALKDVKGTQVGRVASSISKEPLPLPKKHLTASHGVFSQETLPPQKTKKQLPQKKPAPTPSKPVLQKEQKNVSQSAPQLIFPIKNTDLSLIFSTPESTIQSLTNRDLILHFSSLFAAIFLIGTLLFWLFSKPLIRPLRKLGDLMQKTATGQIPPPYRTCFLGFEINRLGKQFNQVLERLKVDKEPPKKSASLEIERSLQESLLPQNLSLPGFEVASTFLPGQTLSTPLVFSQEMKNGALFFCLAEVEPTSLSQALLLKGALSSLLLSNADLSKLSKKLEELFDPSTLSLQLALYHPSSQILSYQTLSAEQNPTPILLKQKNHIERLTSTTAPEKIELEENDLLFFYTKSLPYQEHVSQETFTLNRIEKELLKNQDSSAEHFNEKLKSSLLNFTKNAAPQEDLLWVALRVL